MRHELEDTLYNNFPYTQFLSCNMITFASDTDEAEEAV
jgi:hypothetical protein